MIPLILLLLSIEGGPDGEARIQFTLDRPVGIASGELLVELDESRFGDISGFAVFSGAGDAVAVAQVEGRRVSVSFSSSTASIGRVAGRPVLTLHAPLVGTAAATAAIDGVKVSVGEGSWRGAGMQVFQVRVAEGPVPDEALPEERFDSMAEGLVEGYFVQFPKQRLLAGEGGAFRGLVPGGIAVRNPHPFPVDLLLQSTGILRDVYTERRMRLGLGEAHYESGSPGYAQVYGSAELEMVQLRRQVGLTALQMVPVAAKPIEFVASPAVVNWHWRVGSANPNVAQVQVRPATLLGYAPVLQPEFRIISEARWLRVSRWASDRLTIAVEPTGLVPGVYRDVIRIEPVATDFFPAGAAATISAVLTVSADAQQKVSLRSLRFPLFHREFIGATASPGQAFTSTVYPNVPRNWLTVNSEGTVASNGDLLGPGYYGGHVVLRGANFSDVIQVTTSVPGGGPLIETAAASGVQFVMASTVPAAERFAVRAPGAVTAVVQTDSGGNWLTVLAEAGWVTLGVNPVGLRAGAYTALVTLTSPGAAGPTQIPVALLVTPNPPEALVADPGAIDLLVFRGELSRPYLLRMSSGLRAGELQWSVEADGGSRWLLLEEGSDENWIARLRIDPSALAPGVYTGRVRVRSLWQSVEVPVRLTVVEPEPGAAPYLGSILNAASRRESRVLAAGEEIEILTSRSGFLEVSLDGIPVPRVGAVVPAELAGRDAVTLRLSDVPWRASAEYVIPMAAAAPGVFTVDESGKGLAVVRNGDGTMNGEETQAVRGSVVWLQATGVKADDVVVEIGGLSTRAMYVFAVEEGKPGRDWIEFVVPANAPVGEVSVVVVSAGTRSQKNVFLYVE
jgi:uncharacterized protein (TIGR03437 family)